jgi:hypothetical protein
LLIRLFVFSFTHHQIEREQEDVHQTSKQIQQNTDEQSEKDKEQDEIKPDDIKPDDMNKKYEIKKEALIGRIKKWEKQCQE